MAGECGAIGEEGYKAVGIVATPVERGHHATAHKLDVARHQRWMQQPIGEDVPRGVELLPNAAETVQRPVGFGVDNETAACASPRRARALLRIIRAAVLGDMQEQGLDPLCGGRQLPGATEQIHVHGDDVRGIVGTQNHAHAANGESRGDAVEWHQPTLGRCDRHRLLGPRTRAAGDEQCRRKASETACDTSADKRKRGRAHFSFTKARYCASVTDTR